MHVYEKYNESADISPLPPHGSGFAEEVSQAWEGKTNWNSAANEVAKQGSNLRSTLDFWGTSMAASSIAARCFHKKEPFFFEGLRGLVDIKYFCYAICSFFSHIS